MMLCNSIKDLSNLDISKYFVQEKKDGIRAMFSIQKENIVKNRHEKDITANFPELKSLKVSLKRCVLDGEIVCFKDKKEDFGTTLSREMTQDKLKISLMSRKFPAVFFAFDILVFNSIDMTKRALIARRKILESSIFNGFEQLKVLPFYEDYSNILEKAKEGIVLKEKNSKYLYGVRNSAWLKYKKRIEKIIKFTSYEASLEAKKLIDKFGFVTAEVEGLEVNESGLIRMPILKRVI